MGFVSGLLGTAGGANGTGVSAPGAANLILPTTKKQATDSYTANQNALSQQQNFLNAVQATNGLGNQTSVYNQLQGVANGTGPNPAQAQLAQATGANTANQAALMAGQRGAGQNVGLIARQAAQQGAANQQNSIGQAATLQAQQSLNALSNMGSIANTQASQQQAAQNAYTSAQQAEQQALLNSIAQENSSKVGQQSSINSANANLAGQTMGAQYGLIGGLLNSGGAAAAHAEGGEIKRYDDGGEVSQSNQNQFNLNGPQSALGKSLKQGPFQMGDMQQNSGTQIGQAIGKGVKSLYGYMNSGDSGGVSSPMNNTGANQMSASPFAKGGKVPALVSPGEVYLNPSAVQEVSQGMRKPMDGEKIPGKPKVSGAKNSYANDTVSRTLDEGGIVLPRSVTQSKDKDTRAAEFVRQILAKKRL